MIESDFSYLYAILILIVLLFKIANKIRKRSIIKIRDKNSVLYLLYLSYILACYPFVDTGNDKNTYSLMFDDPVYALVTGDYGWFCYTYLCKNVLGSANIWIFFFITDLIYCFSFYYFALKRIPTGYRFYFVFLATSLMGFWGGGVNTIRIGFALSIVFLALSIDNFWKQFFLFLIAASIHKTTGLIAVSFYYSMFAPSSLTKFKLLYRIWILCLLLSYVGISLTTFSELFGDVDQRVTQYSTSSETEYKVGFRYDFVLYSAFFVYILKTFYYKYKIKDSFLDCIATMFMFVNSFWLLIIRIPFTDRVAYLSWFLAPIIVVYPFSKGLIPQHENKKLKIWTFILVFFNLFLIIRNW